MPMRMRGALRYFVPGIARVMRWTFTSREFANYTYDLTETNLSCLAHTISVATGVDHSLARAYLLEIQTDNSLREHVRKLTASSGMRHSSDPTCYLGRRVGWYAFVRVLKPRLVVETGVERGHGSVVICSALMRNKAEGYDGKYIGTDKDPNAGFLLTEPYSEFGKILYGDSIESLKAIRNIDLFINDSDHSADYEYREYLTIADNLSPDAVILGDNAHISDSLLRFSEERRRHFLFFPEKPKDHWYPGAGIGISFCPKGLKSDSSLSSDTSSKVR